MADRPYILLSCGISIDGYLDNASEHRLMLSNDADLDRVDEVRAGCDAILVGAATVRADNPRLVVRDRPGARSGSPTACRPTPAKVTVTGHAQLDPRARFFRTGGNEKLVYCASDAVTGARRPAGRRWPP